MSICTKCNLDKLGNFPVKKSGKIDSWCNDCHKLSTKIFKRTKDGLVGEIYNAQKHSSKLRGHNPPNYSKVELKEWLFSQNKYHIFFDNWVDSGYISSYRPSVDRNDDYKPYSLDNISLMTWGENRSKHHDNIRMAMSTGGERCKPIIKYDKNMNELCRFISASEASRQCCLTQGHISACCRGERLSHGGFKWRFENDNGSKFSS